MPLIAPVNPMTDILNNIVHEIVAYTVRLKALTADFSVPFTDLDPACRILAAFYMGGANDLFGILNRAGHAPISGSFNHLCPGLVDYQKSMIDAINALTDIPDIDAALRRAVAQANAAAEPSAADRQAPETIQ